MSPLPRLAERDEQHTCGVGEIATRLGQTNHTPRWHASFVGRLIERQSFPSPYPLMIGARLITDAHPKSRWSRAAVDQWFDDRIPPDAAARIDRAAMREAASSMDARAEELGLRIVQGGRP